jgi:hypothetical protein
MQRLQEVTKLQSRMRRERIFFGGHMKPGWHPKTFGVAATNVGGCIHLRQYLVLSLGTMTVLQPLAILEAAVL